jgi:serine protease Do
MLSNSSPGYLGVGMQDVNNARATALKLKDPHGAEITTVDQDAPASNAGIKLHDVVVQMNGQRVDSAEQFSRLLREIPPNRTISLVAIRDGQPLNFSIQLADRTALAKKTMGDLDSDQAPVTADNGSLGSTVLPGDPGHSGGRSGGLFGSLTRNRYYTGVDLQPLPTGLADYFGARNGVLVGNVFSNSPAAAAGLKAADVIQKVNNQPVVSVSDWERAIRLNRGKPVQVTVIRDRKEIVLTMVAGEAKKSSELDFPHPDPPRAQTFAELKTDGNGVVRVNWGDDPGSLAEVGGLPTKIWID